MSTTVIKALANAFHVLSTSNGMHRERWSAILDDIEENLPSGSGIDCGTKINRERSTSERIILSTSFHHMNDGGMYDGWTEHTITVEPSLLFGLNIKISGRNRNDIKDYLADVYREALEAEYVFPPLEAWEPKQANA